MAKQKAAAAKSSLGPHLEGGHRRSFLGFPVDAFDEV